LGEKWGSKKSGLGKSKFFHKDDTEGKRQIGARKDPKKKKEKRRQEENKKGQGQNWNSSSKAACQIPLGEEAKKEPWTRGQGEEKKKKKKKTCPGKRMLERRSAKKGKTV